MDDDGDREDGDECLNINSSPVRYTQRTWMASSAEDAKRDQANESSSSPPALSSVAPTPDSQDKRQALR